MWQRSEYISIYIYAIQQTYMNIEIYITLHNTDVIGWFVLLKRKGLKTNLYYVWPHQLNKTKTIQCMVGRLRSMYIAFEYKIFPLSNQNPCIFVAYFPEKIFVKLAKLSSCYLSLIMLILYLVMIGSCNMQIHNHNHGGSISINNTFAEYAIIMNHVQTSSIQRNG